MTIAFKHVRIALALTLPVLLASCGSTGAAKDASGQTITKSSRTFAKVSVRDFTTSLDAQKTGVTPALQIFPDKIAAEIKKNGKFASVTRNGKTDADTLVIGGEVTRYKEGNAALRLLVGMGAGSSYFDAKTQFSESKGAVLGSIATDKNSWVLGGGLAAMQTPDAFMTEAAKAISAESAKFAK